MRGQIILWLRIIQGLEGLRKMMMMGKTQIMKGEKEISSTLLARRLPTKSGTLWLVCVEAEIEEEDSSIIYCRKFKP